MPSLNQPPVFHEDRPDTPPPPYEEGSYTPPAPINLYPRGVGSDAANRLMSNLISANYHKYNNYDHREKGVYFFFKTRAALALFCTANQHKISEWLNMGAEGEAVGAHEADYWENYHTQDNGIVPAHYKVTILGHLQTEMAQIVDYVNAEKKRYMIATINSANLEIAQTLFNTHNVNDELDDHGNTALHLAAQGTTDRHHELIGLFLPLGADMDKRNSLHQLPVAQEGPIAAAFARHKESFITLENRAKAALRTDPILRAFNDNHVNELTGTYKDYFKKHLYNIPANFEQDFVNTVKTNIVSFGGKPFIHASPVEHFGITFPENARITYATLTQNSENTHHLRIKFPSSVARDRFYNNNLDLFNSTNFPDQRTQLSKAKYGKFTSIISDEGKSIHLTSTNGVRMKLLAETINTHIHQHNGAQRPERRSR